MFGIETNSSHWFWADIIQILDNISLFPEYYFILFYFNFTNINYYYFLFRFLKHVFEHYFSSILQNINFGNLGYY